MLFRDRADAGRRLAERLQRYRAEAPVVVGLPRGGVPVAAEVARALDAPLDVLVVRKLGCPWQPELALGAVGEGDVTVLNQQLIAGIGLGREEVEAVARAERAELDRRVGRYRRGRPAEPVQGRTVIVVDDGLATGFTARAAIGVLRHRGAGRVVLAVPVAPPQAIRVLRGVADQVVAIETPKRFEAVGQFYADFPQTTDQEVARLLAHPSIVPVPTAAAVDDPVRACDIQAGGVRLAGELAWTVRPVGLVVFAHGSGSSRHSPRNRSVAQTLNQSGLATLLLDLLTPQEEHDRGNVFDIELLAGRLVATTRWLADQPDAVVSRGGRPDLAAPRLGEVRAPTLLIVGGHDQLVLELNRRARARLRCTSALQVVPGATHLFEEPGALERVAALAGGWFRHHLPHSASAQRGAVG